VTYTAGFGNGSSGATTVTLNATAATGLLLVAAGGYWVLLSSMTGTLTNFVPALS